MRMPKDDNGNIIQCMSLPAGNNGAFEKTGSATDVVQIAFTDDTVEAFTIKTDGKIKIALGTDNTVAADADSHGFMAGEKETISIIDDEGKQLYTHLSIYFVEDATVYVSERE